MSGPLISITYLYPVCHDYLLISEAQPPPPDGQTQSTLTGAPVSDLEAAYLARSPPMSLPLFKLLVKFNPVCRRLQSALCCAAQRDGKMSLSALLLQNGHFRHSAPPSSIHMDVPYSAPKCDVWWSMSSRSQISEAAPPQYCAQGGSLVTDSSYHAVNARFYFSFCSVPALSFIYFHSFIHCMNTLTHTCIYSSHRRHASSAALLPFNSPCTGCH